MYGDYAFYSDCEDGDIKLVDGCNSLEGRLEMCYSGVWGTVCNDLWNGVDAAVACRQLGYSSSGIPSLLAIASSKFQYSYRRNSSY